MVFVCPDCFSSYSSNVWVVWLPMEVLLSVCALPARIIAVQGVEICGAMQNGKVMCLTRQDAGYQRHPTDASRLRMREEVKWAVLDQCPKRKPHRTCASQAGTALDLGWDGAGLPPEGSAVHRTQETHFQPGTVIYEDWSYRSGHRALPALGAPSAEPCANTGSSCGA